MKSNVKKTVFVGLSGGVDSSVATLRLLKAGYDVVGVFIKVWQPDFLKCNWEDERLDAMRIAAKLGIPFLTCDAEQAYKDSVALYFIEEYKAGRTPNPDVMCNKYVKFGTFLDFALERGADFIATGHYARHDVFSSEHRLLRGVDAEKDQSYFLWTLTQKQLSHILLPIGDSKKSIIRTEAKNAGLVTAEKKDSQGICFLGQVDIKEFLGHYISLEKGDVLDSEGNVIGEHEGALVYTHGQRHGFTITKADSARTPLYVTAKNTDKNTITVASHHPIQETESILKLKDTNYIAWAPTLGAVVTIQTRYRQKPVKCTVRAVGSNMLTLVYTDLAEYASVGQSCVLYQADVCCGGGIIT